MKPKKKQNKPRKDQVRLNFEKAEQARKKLESDPHFREAVFDIQSKYRIVLGDSEREEFLNKLPEKKVFLLKSKILIPDLSYRVVSKDSPLYRDIVNLLKQFQLPGESWFDSVSQYVLYNEFSPGFKGLQEAEAEAEIIERKDPLTGLIELSIKIGRNTTIEDIKFLWPMVEVVRRDAYDEEPPKRRFGQRKNFERDYYMYRLYNTAGRKLSTEVMNLIMTKVKAKFNQELEHQTIRTSIDRIKKELDKKPLKK